MKISEKYYDNWNVKFVYSPLFEMLCSLHVLTKPDHHLERLNWAREMKDRMNGKLYNDILFFGTNFFSWFSIEDFCDMYDEVNDLNIISALDFILESEIVEFTYIMLGTTIEKSTIEACIKYKSESGLENLTKEQKSIFADPEGFKRRIVACLKEYYYVYFEKELRFIEPLLIRNMKKQVDLCEKIGVKEFVNSLHSRIQVTDSAFILHKYVDFVVPFSELDEINIHISSFIDPHLLIGLEINRCAAFTIRAHLTEGLDEIPMDLYKTMKALGDDTRLKIVKYIYKELSSTQSLAKHLNLTEACVSKHLKILYEADILYKERKGNYIYYLLNKKIIDCIPLEMYQYLEG